MTRRSSSSNRERQHAHRRTIAHLSLFAGIVAGAAWVFQQLYIPFVALNSLELVGVRVSPSIWGLLGLLGLSSMAVLGAAWIMKRAEGTR